jgi:hypothetical protein
MERGFRSVKSLLVMVAVLADRHDVGSDLQSVAMLTITAEVAAPLGSQTNFVASKLTLSIITPLPRHLHHEAFSPSRAERWPSIATTLASKRRLSSTTNLFVSLRTNILRVAAEDHYDLC